MIPISLVMAILGLLSIVLAAPHTGMINNDYVHDVGAVYRKVDYEGDSNFLLSVKAEPTCMPFNGNVASIMVCVPVTYAVYTVPDCGQTEGGSDCAFTVTGPGDVQEVPNRLRDIRYGSYICASDGIAMGAVTGGEALKTTPHDASMDKFTTMNQTS